MAAYNKFQDFIEQLGKGVHQLHAAGHTFKAYLSNTTPSALADAVKGDLAEFAGGTGYTAGGSDMQQDYTETGGTGTLTAVDITWTATAGDWVAFQYVVAYNTIAAPLNNPLLCWHDHGSPLTLGNGESFTVDYGASLATFA